MSNSEYELISLTLNEIETELKKLNKWSGAKSHPKALFYKEPFAMDVMEFHEWLQYILLERFRCMIKNKQKLPTNFKIFPYAYEVYKQEINEHITLLKLIKKLDNLFQIK